MLGESKGKEVRWDIVCAVMAIVMLGGVLVFIFWIAWIYPYFYFNPESRAAMKPLDKKATSLYYETYTLLDNPKLKWPYPWKNDLWEKAQMIYHSIHQAYLSTLDGGGGVAVSDRDQYKQELDVLEKCLAYVKTFPRQPNGYCERGDFLYVVSIVNSTCDWQRSCHHHPVSTLSNQSFPHVVGAIMPALVNRNPSDDDDATRGVSSEPHPVVEEGVHGFGGGAHAVAVER